MKNILEIDSVILNFGDKRILHDVFLRCSTGNVVGLLGRNGTGKSSIFKIMFGELMASSQSIRINDRALMGSKRLHSDLRYLPQKNFLPKNLTIRRILNDFNLSFEELISCFPEFEFHYKSKIKTLSTGQRRIFEIFVILRSKTKFALLDEPFSQVMPLHIDSIKHIIKREKLNKGIILTDHIYMDVCDLCDQVYLIKDGKTHLTNNILDLQKLGYLKPDH